MKITQSPQWKALLAEKCEVENLHLKTLFEDSSRFERFSTRWNEFFLDFSKNRMTEKTWDKLLDLAHGSQLRAQIDSMFEAKRINTTENRAVLHTALRNPPEQKVCLDGTDIIPQIHEVLSEVRDFSDQVRSGAWKGFSGKTIETVVNIGIGGSDLGPRMVVEALAHFTGDMQVRFVSNVDATELVECLKNLHPDRTLFLVASKTFTTQETMTNARSARKWIVDHLGEEAVSRHFAAMSTNVNAAREFGINPQAVFGFWDFVGGRYSLWSCIGLPIACSIGYEAFEKLLLGAHEMDQHFRDAPFEKNLPVILGLLGTIIFWTCTRMPSCLTTIISRALQIIFNKWIWKAMAKAWICMEIESIIPRVPYSGANPEPMVNTPFFSSFTREPRSYPRISSVLVKA